ncbi:MAG: PcfJ domain-containing protein [Clostridia bacterium]
MIVEENIKAIPKYMLDKIKKLDKISNPKPNGNNRFYTYFTKYKKELCSVTVAVRNKYKNWYSKQVVVHGIHSDEVYLRDIALSMGFILIGWHREGLTKYPSWHDYDWGTNDDKYFQMQTATIVNKEYILSLPEFKYSLVDKYNHTDIMKYLRFYEKYPECEYLVKAGLSKLATSKQILAKCSKDKKFCKWLYQNKDEIAKDYFYTLTLLTAYKQNKTLKETQKYIEFKKHFSIKDNFKELKDLFKKDLDKFFIYLLEQKTNGYCYIDYLQACQYLRLDMNIDKNRYPHNFKKWHNIRIDEYVTAKALKDAKERKELYKKFKKVASKYLTLQKENKDNYVCIIAKSPIDLIKEGEKLNHCVGKMNYDQKFIKEESLIFFVRNKQEPQTPFVTLEYSLENHKVLQCYGEHDSKPENKVMNFVNKIWLPYANKQLKSMAI